ncbi:MAG: hypothetical protein ACJ8BW_25820 [Ktedonobacteraceae bacterium]
MKKIGNVSCIAAQAEAAKLDSLRQLTERLRDRLGSGVVVLGSVIGGRPQIIVSLKTPRAKAAGVQSVASNLPRVSRKAGSGVASVRLLGRRAPA